MKLSPIVGVHYGLRRLALGLSAFLLPLAAGADSTTLHIFSASVNTAGTSTTLKFPVTRTGDTSYDAWLPYATQDGTALAGTDYTAASGQIMIPAGSSSTTIPVTIAANTSGGADKNFQVLLSAGLGAGPSPAFGAAATVAVGSQPNNVAAADFNGDGKPDLAVTNTNSNTVSILLNNTAAGAASASYALVASPSTGDFPDRVAAGDFNGDGKPDLAVTNQRSNNVSILLNTTAPGAASASFTLAASPAVGKAPSAVVVGDFNGDGKPDLAVTNSNDDTVSILLNNTTAGAGSASFILATTAAVGSDPTSLAAGDFNGDGKPDLAVVNVFDNSVSILLNNTAAGAASASFTLAANPATGSLPISVTVGDFNGDGKPDLAVANAFDNSVSILLNNTAAGAASASFTLAASPATGSLPISVTVGDFNGDGKPDIAVLNSSDNNFVTLYNTTAPGSTGASFTLTTGAALGNGPQAVTAADLNGDGRLDLAVANGGSDNVSILLNNTPTPAAVFNLAAQQTFATGIAPESVVAADVNGDGKPDLLVANSSSIAVSVLLNTTAPGATTPSYAAQQSFATGSTPYAVAAADVNGDGRPDLLVANSGSNTVSVLLNTTAPGATTPSYATQQTFATGAGPGSVAAADINGDGKPDLLVANHDSSFVSVLLNTTLPGDTTPSFAAQQGFTVGLNSESVAAADLNGDGKPDLLVANSGSNTVSVLLNNTAPGDTTPSFAAQQTFATGTNPTSVTAADVNGDGLPDLVVLNFTSRTVSVLLNTTAPGAATPSFAAQQAFAAGVDPLVVVAADLDGDGKPDLVIANHANPGSVSVLLNTTATGAATPSFAPQKTFATGIFSYSVAVTDLNGDGKPDVVVANRNSNNVGVLLNTQFQTALTRNLVTGTIHEAPAAPTGLTATPGGGKVTLNWTAASGATGYQVFKSTASGTEVAPAAAEVSSPATSATVTGLTSGITYYFVVRAVNGSTPSAFSNEANAAPTGPPPAPTSLVATPGNGKVTLNWAASSGATRYQVFKSTAAGTEIAPAAAEVNSPATSATVSGLSSTTTYYFVVRALNANGASGFSNEVTTVPAGPPLPPASLVATPGNGSVGLSWTASSGAARYQVYTSTAAGTETGPKVVEVNAPTAGVTVTGLNNGTTYYFVVRALNANGASGFSNEASAVPE